MVNKKYTATKEFNFEAGHCLDGHQGKCKNLHGHNYKVFITIVSSDLNSMGMVKDFYDIATFAKPFFDEFDHAFMYNVNAVDSFEHDIAKVCKMHQRKIRELPFKATAEHMAEYFYYELNNMLPPTMNNAYISKVTVYETPTSFSTFEEVR